MDFVSKYQGVVGRVFGNENSSSNEDRCSNSLHKNFEEMDEPKESHRTRSRAAPEWRVEESLVLVNEISAVESEWGATLPSFQKWQQIVQNCHALDVTRNLNQCKRKWDALLTHYRRVKHGEAPLNASFPVELFKAIDGCVITGGKTNAGGGEAAAVEEVAIETDPDSDPEAQGGVTMFSFETASKKQRRRMKRKRRRLETRNPWGYFTSIKIKHEEIPEKMENTNTPEENSNIEKEQILATMLHENALQIYTIVEGNLADDVDCKLSDLKNAEAVRTDCIRRQGDKLIDCLGEIASTLNQLCDLAQKCN